jgi:hypothetical protein
MNKKANLSERSRAMLEKAKADAHERVVQRGLLQFRADAELVDQLLQIADYKKIPVSVLVRSWVAEHVRQEYPLVPLRQVKLVDGAVLTQESSYRQIEDAVRQHGEGKIQLNPRELRTLHDWLLDLHNEGRPERKII